MTSGRIVKVCIVYPADPVGVIPGGIDTFIRGILRWAPDDVEISLVGVTTESNKRPVGQWTVCDLGRSRFRFFPVIALKNPAGRSKFPLSVRFVLGLLRRRPEVHADVLEFHRLEPSLLYLWDQRPRTAIVHQNMQELDNKQSDILWRHFPGLFYWLEDRLIPRFSSVYAVREDAVAWYRERYSRLSDRFSFLPTWYDPEIFFPAPRDDAKDMRAVMRKEFGFRDDTTIIITVGRLDSQKDPMLVARSFQHLARQRNDVRLIFVGDGVLREKVESFVREAGLSEYVRLAGLRSAPDVAVMLRASDLFVLGSAYEGMPMCVLEALGSGIPVVTTDVGEVNKVVKSGQNGFVVSERTPDAISHALDDALTNLDRFRCGPCVLAANKFVPEKVLAPLYDNYRVLAAKGNVSE
jgi:glycosyltransferase involved in cell wall biosynthesis